MTTILTVVTLPVDTGIPADAIDNTFVHTGTAAPADIATNVQPQIMDFYNGLNNTHPVAWYLSPSLDRGAGKATIKSYDVSGNLAAVVGVYSGSPVASATWTLGPEATAGDLYPMPSKVASALSYHGTLAGLPVEQPNPAPPPALRRPRSRHTGRIFLGPLTLGAVASPVGFLARPAAAFRSDACVAAARLMVAGDAVNGKWSVWSRKNAATYPVVGGFMDDRFDIMKSRGEKASARTTFGV